MKNIICVTGHRPTKLGGYGEKAKIILLETAKECLELIKPKIVISGMALGWDQAVAYTCIQMNIPFHAYIPCDSQERMWPQSSQDEYKYLLSKSSHQKICSPGFYAPWKMQERNKNMVNDSELVLALWDGSSGGTKNCVDYAQKINKEVYNCYNKYLKFVDKYTEIKTETTNG